MEHAHNEDIQQILKKGTLAPTSVPRHTATCKKTVAQSLTKEITFPLNYGGSRVGYFFFSLKKLTPSMNGIESLLYQIVNIPYI